jgi:hypothetical protein
MNVSYRGTTFEMGSMKWLYAQSIPIAMATAASTFDGIIQRITFIIALMTAVIFMLLQFHNYRIARRKDISDIAERKRYEDHR